MIDPIHIVLAAWWSAFHWVLFASGASNPSGPEYGWWSGFFGDVTIFAGLAFFLRSRNCHVKGCWRHGHEVPGTPYRACRRHNPAMHDDPDTTVQHIADAHAQANQ